MKDTAIIVASFGTSYVEPRKKNIEAMELAVAKAHPEADVFRAWTSRMIIRKLRKRDGLDIPTPTECMEQAVEAGYKKVYVLPTHILHGYEYNALNKEVKQFADRFDEIVCCDPLIHDLKDISCLSDSLSGLYGKVKEGEALIWMGHGTEHYANSMYCALDYWMRDHGMEHAYVATVEGYPLLESVLRLIGDKGYHTIHLAPLMFVAGDHALNDMAGEEADSWKSVLEEKGYHVVPHIRGLGEDPTIQKIYLEHLDRKMSR